MLSPQKGLTLVELMVGLAIMAAVMLTAVPLTSGWVDSASVTESKAALQKAFSRTKTVALENPAKIVNASAAAYLCNSAGVVYVQAIDEGTCGTRPIWKTTLKTNVALSVSQASFSCIGLNNLGLPVALTLASGTVCSVSKTVSVKKGQATDARTLY